VERRAALLLALAAVAGCSGEKASEEIEGRPQVAVQRPPTPQEIADACWAVERRVYRDDPDNGYFVEPTYDTYRVRAPRCSRHPTDKAAVTCRFEAASLPFLSFRSEADEAAFIRRLRPGDYEAMEGVFVSVRAGRGAPAAGIEWVAPEVCQRLPKADAAAP
jgi:hypothetical protein